MLRDEAGAGCAHPRNGEGMKRSPLLQVSWAIIGTCALLALALIASEWRQSLAQPTRNGHLVPLQAPTVLGAQTVIATAPEQYWQVGAMVDMDAHNFVGMRTRIRTRLPSHIADQTADYFWIGSYLADHSFIQVGYVVSWRDHSPRWFYCTFDSAGKQGPCPNGPVGSAGPVGSWHTYDLRASTGQSAGMWQWTVQVDGQTVGILPELAGSTGLAMPTVFAEQSAYAPHAATNDLGPVEFAPAFTLLPAGEQWQPATSARAVYSTQGTCPPYGVGVGGVNDILLGSHLTCLSDGTSLW